MVVHHHYQYYEPREAAVTSVAAINHPPALESAPARTEEGVGPGPSCRWVTKRAQANQIRKVAAFCDDAIHTAVVTGASAGIGDLQTAGTRHADRYGRNSLGRMSALIAPASCSDPVATQNATD